MSQGWTCPRCNRVYGPSVTECWRCNSNYGGWYPNQPSYPWWQYPMVTFTGGGGGYVTTTANFTLTNDTMNIDPDDDDGVTGVPA